MAAAQKIIFQHLRERKVKELSVQHGFYFRVTTVHRVAEHHYVCIGRDIFRAIPLSYRDALFLKKSRHRRIRIFVRSSDLESALLARCRQRRHGRAANPKEMKFLRRFLHAGEETTDYADFTDNNS